MGIEWLAGLLQGRGHLRLCSSYEIAVRSKDRELLVVLEQLYGGTVWSNMKSGEITWAVYGPDALEYMRRVQPFLYGEKRERLDNLLEV